MPACIGLNFSYGYSISSLLFMDSQCWAGPWTSSSISPSSLPEQGGYGGGAGRGEILSIEDQDENMYFKP